MQLLSRTGGVVTGVANWPRPKEAYQWRAGRSAMELARRWFPNGVGTVPPELCDLLDSHPLTAGAVIREVRPEFKTELPEKGEGRNHDLLVRAIKGTQAITIGVEAKTDEPFGECIGDHCRQSRSRNKRSGVPLRARKLLSYLFNSQCDPYREPFSGLRYQLLTAAAATASQAFDDRALLGVLVVHELDTWRVQPDKASSNHRDFAQFVSMFTGVRTSDVVPGRLYGPVSVSSVNYRRAPIDLLVGKVKSPHISDWTANEVSSLLLDDPAT